jgi:hypothetical protein
MFQQFKPSVLLLESTILKIWGEYMLKTIDENNRGPTGNNAIQIWRQEVASPTLGGGICLNS